MASKKKIKINHVRLPSISLHWLTIILVVWNFFHRLKELVFWKHWQNIRTRDLKSLFPKGVINKKVKCPSTCQHLFTDLLFPWSSIWFYRFVDWLRFLNFFSCSEGKDVNKSKMQLRVNTWKLSENVRHKWNFFNPRHAW